MPGVEALATSLFYRAKPNTMRKILFFSILLVFVTSCKYFGKRVKGSGKVVSESRAVTGYNSVDVSSSIDLYIKQDSAYSIRVETDDNLMEYIDTYEEGGTLYIEQQNRTRLSPSSDIKVYVSGPSFRKLTASGACDIYTQGLITGTESVAIKLTGSSDAELEINAPRVTADLTGAGSLKLSGQTKDLDLDGTGSSSMKCIGMLAENVEVGITGAGSAEVFASVKLDVKVTGSGSVKYKGNAAVNQRISGAGSIKKIE